MNDNIDSFNESCWHDFDYSSLLNDVPPVDLHWNPELQPQWGRNDAFSAVGSKACRERKRREKLNDRFSELCSILEPGRPVKADKLAILGDAIRVLNELKSESQEYEEMNEKLLEEIKTLKVEKNELREEKLLLKADKERIEQQMNAMTVSPAGFVPTHSPVYQTGANKIAMFPGYSFVPLWQYHPPSTNDTYQDQKDIGRAA
ncbi:transcription factor bHLH104-like [Olea europaea subsp. europaea]|uniref:Transcription factor bHLH104-like n=1 Tax=Olea europaea subsp. europaea TaxID=158383 RepID=A0A8S0PRA7_OLEEU|nr:transcription factor bHLH104-like [Olea europaea subsp. europaea]